MTDDEFARVSALFVPKKVRKRQFLLQTGDVCKAFAFISKGCLRCYTVDSEGAEHVIKLCIHGSWISDLESFRTGRPATSDIDALEDSEVLMIDKTSLEKLYCEVPKLETFFRKTFENVYNAALQRITDFVSASAEERYCRFLKTYPDIVQTVPLHQIASYLGITPQTLSRFRKKLARNA